MPDSGPAPGLLVPAAAVVPRARLASPLLRRILLVNALPLVLLVATLLYLDQYQTGLLQAEVTTLREQARIFAGALAQAAVRSDGTSPPHLVADVAQPLLRSLTEPTPNAQARVYAPNGTIIADSRVAEGPGGAVRTEPLPPPPGRGAILGAIGAIYDRILAWLPHPGGPLLDTGPTAGGPDWQPDVKRVFHPVPPPRPATPGAPGAIAPPLTRQIPAYVRRSADGRLLVTVGEPVLHDRKVVGIVLLTREAREVDDSLLTVRLSILALFGFALALTVLLSWYLSLTIARPLLRLARAAAEMREGRGRAGEVPSSLLARRDEIGELAHALASSARALWARMDAIEHFAADVAHEIKNPLTSIQSAIETWRRIESPEKQRQLLGIVAEDVGRLDRLISDISDASRIDAELSRVATERVRIMPILATLVAIHEMTRAPDGPRLVLEPGGSALAVRAIEDRLVQVLRNLIGNALSFSPPGGTIRLGAQGGGGRIAIHIDDEGPGIPADRLEHIFDRFYSERPEGERFGQHSGLGLSISRQIIEALGGTLTAENLAPRGARFTIRLPAA